MFYIIIVFSTEFKARTIKFFKTQIKIDLYNRLSTK